MKKIFIFALFCILSEAFVTAQKDFTASYVDLGRQSAALYEPINKSEKSQTAIVVMHSHQDYMNFVANSELAARGYTVLATTPGEDDKIESKLLRVKACVDYLRNRDDIKDVVLLGHSGGATIMTAYQLLAENGREVLSGKLYPDYSHRIDSLPKADGIMLLDANPGLSTILLNSIDPNVSDESTGYVQDIKYTYDDAKAYMQGQQERYALLVDKAEERLDSIKAGEGLYADDEPLVIPGSNSMRFYNKLYSSNTSLLHHTKQPWPQMHADGSISVDTVYSVRAPFNPIEATEQLSTAQNLTVRNFLSSYAMRVDSNYEIMADGFKGIHFDSNLTSPIGNISGIYVPSLFMGMTGSYEYLTSEAIYNNSPSLDKDIMFVEGAGHMFTADQQAEKYNGVSYGDTKKLVFDYVDNWLSSRYSGKNNVDNKR